MAAPAYEMSPQQETQPEPPKAELRLVRPEQSPAEMETALKENAEVMKTEAADNTQELTAGTAAIFDDLAKRNEAVMTPEENAEQQAIGQQAQALEQTFKAEAAAVTQGEALLQAAIDETPDAPQAPAEAKAANDNAPEATVSPVPEAEPEPAKPEAKVEANFDELLSHLAPEARAAAAKNFAEADETSYGGMASKQMTEDGVVRMGYKDGTIVEIFPGGEKRSNLPDATGAERIPELPDYLKEARPMNEQERKLDPEMAELEDMLRERGGEVPMSAEEHRDIMDAALLVLEKDNEQDKEELERLRKEANPEQEEAVAKLDYRTKFADLVIKKKNTPPHLRAEAAKLDEEIEAEKSAMASASPEEQAMHMDRIKQYTEQKEEIAKRVEEAEKAQGEDKEKKGAQEKEQMEKERRAVEFEQTMRNLEDDLASAGTTEEKLAVARELEAASREWARLSEEAGAGKESAQKVIDSAVALVLAYETIKALEAKKEEDLTPEEKAKLEDAKEKTKTMPSSKTKEAKESYAAAGGGGGEVKSLESHLDEVADEWMYWEKLLGGWAKKG